jgi:hypothetical protein
MPFYKNGISHYKGGMNDFQERIFFVGWQLLLYHFYRKLEWTWGDSGANKAELKIHSYRPWGGRD